MVRLDRIDVKILAELQKNGRLTNVELASRVGLSASPCLQRTKQLEKEGYISSFRAVLELAKIGESVMVFTEMTLSDHRRNDFIKFEREIRRWDSVIECHLISGGYDYLVKFVARSIAHYQEIMEEILDRNIGLEKYFSYVVIKSVIPGRPLPLEMIADRD
ncbi:winged helix-turn-helix transcriptional regulator [Gymnodinialimonas sp. 2305UL16-5]|uniref:Lrp/AsnC family transcriptional regulator n=1 Tax=Gymnodinialimonas mytili TaxID=3126503 RepID=UPI0030A90F02